tara:strand:+ start:818 stop:1138 length:321 start_codon:yes stop_codon:yes gene_type:complete
VKKLKVFIIKKQFQNSDPQMAYHWVDEDYQASCDTRKSAVEHIKVLLKQDYEDELKQWNGFKRMYDKPIHDNKVHLTEEFNGRGGKLYDKYIIEEEELITYEDKKG